MVDFVLLVERGGRVVGKVAAMAPLFPATVARGCPCHPKVGVWRSRKTTKPRVPLPLAVGFPGCFVPAGIDVSKGMYLINDIDR